MSRSSVYYVNRLKTKSRIWGAERRPQDLIVLVQVTNPHAALTDGPLLLWRNPRHSEIIAVSEHHLEISPRKSPACYAAGRSPPYSLNNWRCCEISICSGVGQGAAVGVWTPPGVPPATVHCESLRFHPPPNARYKSTNASFRPRSKVTAELSAGYS